MDIIEIFNNALLFPSEISSQEKEKFLGKICSAGTNSDTNSPLLRLLSGGEVSAVAPWRYRLSSMDCFLLLYTKEGCGNLTVNNKSYSLQPNSLLFLNGHCEFRIEIVASHWNYLIFFLCGEPLSFYTGLLLNSDPVLLQVSPYSEAVIALENILFYHMTYSHFSMSHQVILSDLLNRIVSFCVSKTLSSGETAFRIPPYITKMRALFDTQFQNYYTLDELAEELGFNKYRLCREFKKAYGISPIQYLNTRRIETAKHLLVTSTAHIHEIGTAVGIENTNHFIQLFKRATGLTPLEYRQNTLV